MAARAYPTDIKIYLDDQDVTKIIFGADTIALSDIENIWRNIDITPLVKYAGLHKLRITTAAGVGRVDAKITIK